jgi:hypothetical protein
MFEAENIGSGKYLVKFTPLYVSPSALNVKLTGFS